MLPLCFKPESSIILSLLHQACAKLSCSSGVPECSSMYLSLYFTLSSIALTGELWWCTLVPIELGFVVSFHQYFHLMSWTSCFPSRVFKASSIFFCLRCWSYRRLAQVHPCILEIKPWISAHNIIPIDHVVTQSTKIYHFPYTDLSQFLHSTSQEHTMQQYQITILSQAYISNTCTLPMP